MGHYEFFMVNFAREAKGTGYIVTENESEAAHTIRFAVTPNVGAQQTQNDNQYVVRISLIRNEDNLEVVTFDFFFTELDEVYEYTRTLFQNATLYIPIYNELIIAGGPDNRWKNKWIYLRASFDYPITFYALQRSDELVGGIGLYHTDIAGNPDRTYPIGREIMAMPGFTLGFEFQLFNFFSLELNYQLSWGDTRNNFFVNMAAGAELKFPIKKFQNIVLVPYGAFTLPLTISKIFSEFPPFALGAGVQVCVRGGKNGAFFVDINYMFSFTDAIMYNPWKDYPDLYPNPEVIHYKRSIIGIGIGYKIGFIDR